MILTKTEFHISNSKKQTTAWSSAASHESRVGLRKVQNLRLIRRLTSLNCPPHRLSLS